FIRIFIHYPINVPYYFNILALLYIIYCYSHLAKSWFDYRIKFNLSFVSYYEILKLDLLDANLERYSEIQFQSCLSLHHPNYCCDQFSCPCFNFSNHTYFYLVYLFPFRTSTSPRIKFNNCFLCLPLSIIDSSVYWNQFHTRLLITSRSVRQFHCIQGIFRQFEIAITPGCCDV
ncbi:hypothetical protein BLOT_002667, partial [Blomia tropicalis]